MYLATFPKNWTESFDESKDIDNTSYEEIDHYMEKQKDKADKEYAKKKKEKEKKEEKEKKTAASGSNSRRNSKHKFDPKKSRNVCRKCPNAKHTWSQCFQNPNNPNNKLSDPEFMRKVNNRNNFRNNNQQPRQAFYGNRQPYPYPLPPPPPPPRDGYMSGPPSVVRTQSNYIPSDDRSRMSSNSGYFVYHPDNRNA